MNRYHIFRYLAVALFGAMGLTACSAPADAAYTGNPSGPTVGIVGDSITYLSEANITTDFSSGYYYDTEAYDGATIGDQLLTVTNMIFTEYPHNWIINLGTDDALAVNEGIETAATWQANLATLTNAISYGCVVLININVNADNWNGTSTTAVQINNDELFLSEVEPTHFKYVDWNSLVQNPANGNWLWIDKIHPSNPVGQQKLADLYWLAEQGCS